VISIWIETFKYVVRYAADGRVDFEPIVETCVLLFVEFAQPFILYTFDLEFELVLFFDIKIDGGS
jgi:hypothetical protein